MNNKKKAGHGTLANTLFALRWQFKIAPGYTVFTFLQTVLGNVITLFEHTFLAAHIITCVEQKRPLSSILLFLVPVAVAVSLKLLVGTVFGAYQAPAETAKIQKQIHLTLYQKAAGLDLARYDDTEFYNDFVWAMQKAPEHITAAAGAFNNLVSNLVVGLIAGAYIVTVDFSALPAIALLLPGSYFIQRAINKRFIKMEEETTKSWRRFSYISRVFYLADYVKELKTGQMAPQLEKDLAETTEMLQQQTKKHSRPIARLSFFYNSLDNFIFNGGYLTYLFYNTLVLGRYGLGALTGVYNSAQRFVGNLAAVIRQLPEFQKHSLYIQKLRSFLEAENTLQDLGTQPLPAQKPLTLNQVTFTYPGNQKPTLKNVSLSVEPGQKIALVGFNGAGKSTLIKLIMRLYDPQAGTVCYGGQNIKNYPLSAWRQQFGALFQDYELLATDLAHNLTASPAELDLPRADSALKKAAFWEKFKTLPLGYQTPMTREFEESGLNPSGGEKQKIALARVLYANANIIVLDEPSGALDPIAEYRLNKTVTELSKNQTVIIISHRLSTTRFVDCIYMLANGQIIEQGSHEQLLAQNGEYAKMFSLQAEKYR